FGIHMISATALLATFSGCLATGSYFFGKLADKKINQLFLFALMQMMIGVFIFLHPFLFSKVVSFYLCLNGKFDLGPYSVMFIRVAVSFLYFLIPVSLMGGVLPVLSKLVVDKMTNLGKLFAKLYGLYVCGLVIGAFLTGFVMIRTIGIRHSLKTAAILSVLMALMSLLLFYWEGYKAKISLKKCYRKSHSSDEFVTIAAGKWKKRLLWIFTTGCFATVTYKIGWTRMLLELSADKTVYFYTVLSVVFFVCIATGSFVVSRFADKIMKKFLVLGITEIVIGLASLLSIALFSEISHLFSQPSDVHDTWMMLMAGETGLLLSVFVLPVALTGFVLPLVTRMYAEDLKTLGQKIGILGALDVVGAITASFVVTFIFIPLLGTYKVLVGAAMLNAGLGLFILLRYRRIKNTLRTGLTMATLFLFVAMVFIFNEKKIDSARRDLSDDVSLETRHEGSTATVEVHKTIQNDIMLYINGDRAVSSDPGQLKGDKLLSCLPFLFNPDAEKVCIVGLGIGITAKSMADAAIPEIDIVEISPEVINVAADAYAYVNDNILVHENISIAIEDGRSFLFRAEEFYDIIICNGAHPRMGNALYTKEYYRLCNEKLNAGGYLCQWLPTGWISENEFKSLIKSCTVVFPYATLWHIAAGQTLLLASSEVQQLDYCRADINFNTINREGELTMSGITGVDMILAGLLADNITLRHYVDGVPENTDVVPVVEFSRFVGDIPDKSIIDNLSSLKVSYKDIISFEKCPGIAGEVLNNLMVRNTAMRQKLE
ncbi:MAG: fused MFS/spermidine synthase, partial [Bacteroidales bacterium]|nr:fused MFS/spermidine synthase [Bacteroidales bacterium]